MRLRSLRGYHSPEVVSLIDTCPEEVAVAAFAPELTRIIRLLGQLDSLGGHSTAAWGDVRVQGGSSTPAAERRAELLEELEAMSPKLLKVAEKIRGCPPATSKGKYIGGLLRGLSGNDLQQAAGLSDRKMKENRRWLKSIMAACR